MNSYKLKSYLSGKAKKAKETLEYLGHKQPKKLLFEHIPKCAGSSITAFLVRQYKPSTIFTVKGGSPLDSIQDFKNYPTKVRHSFDLILGHGAHQISKHAHPEMTKITIFRDPVDRVISHYYFILRTPRHYLHKEVKEKELSLKEYVSSNLTSEITNNYIHRFLDSDKINIKSKSGEELTNLSFDIITQEYNAIGFLDEIDSFMEKVCKMTNIPEVYNDLKRENVTHGRKSMNEIDSEIVNIIKERNHYDITLYNKLKDFSA